MDNERWQDVFIMERLALMILSFFMPWGCALICPCFGAVLYSITGAQKCVFFPCVKSSVSCTIFRFRFHSILDN